ncbi:MAG: hypothetical protein WAV05_02900 [Anaerolineales bacterium]
MYPCSPVFIQAWNFIKATGVNIINGRGPGKNTKGELQSLWGKTDDKYSIVHGIEKEQDGKKGKNNTQDAHIASSYTPDEQQ